MGKTSISWTDHSINPIRARDPVTGKAGHHCEKVSPGCQNCYASRLQLRFGLEEYSGPSRREKVEHYLDEGRLREVPRRKVPTKYFWCDQTDLFGEWVPDGWVMRCLDVMAHAHRHTHQILTKRPERMLDFFTRWADLSGEDFLPKMVRGPAAARAAHPSGRGQLFASMLETMGEPPPGCAYPTFDWMGGMVSWPDVFPQIWLGTSVEDRQRKGRIGVLRAVPAAVRFLSLEPLLEDLGTLDLSGIGWTIVGGESGPGARPCRVEWVRSVVAQCKAAGVACWVKQDSGPRPGMQGRLPDDLWGVKEFPGAAAGPGLFGGGG